MDVAARFPDAEVAVILDNVGIHHAEATRAWLGEHPGVHLLFLPRYSPTDNAQERVWGWLRADVCRNRAFLAEASAKALCRRGAPVPLLTGLLAEAFAAPAPAAPTSAAGTDHPAGSVTELLAA